MFRDVPAQLDFAANEREILDFWDREEIYHRSLAQRQDSPRFVFYEGPPTANGLPHPGHCLTRAIKDLFPRYRTMCGYYCERKAGWDTHGLPVEVEVCKELGIHSKEEIERYGIEPFIHRCIESVFRYTREWEDLTRRLGFWVDLDKAYVTYHQTYVESVWWSLKRLFDAGHLYRGDKIVWWWAQGGTALSAGEVGQGYRQVADPSVFVRFPLLDRDHTSLLVWTTTPWTLLSNTFAAVHPDLDYALAEDPSTHERLYVASELLDAIAAKGKRTLERIEVVKGRELVGLRYRPPFDIYAKTLFETRAALREGGDAAIAWRVVAADFVTTDSGSGLVHEAPAFGEVDFELLAKERGRFVDPEAIPLLNAVAPNGAFKDEAGERYRGRWVKEADRDIIRELRERGLLYHDEQYLHDYPFCWRADEDPLIQYPRRSWFIRTTQFKESMLRNNDAIEWLPEHIKKGRFGKFLESNVDWSLSRERYWGTPLPIWVCEESGDMEAIGSYEELLAKPAVEGTDVWRAAKEANPGLSDDLKVHRPYIDAITYASPFTPGARMRRVVEVIDCWYDSGAMPFAQFGYPHRGQEQFASSFPADFISEALDQTRGWFYSLLAISTLLFGPDGVAKSADLPSAWPLPFRNCIVLGLLLGEDGLKMSKSKKNYKSPDLVFDAQGADAMRWLFFSGQAPWTGARFDSRSLDDAKRDFLLRQYNVYSFFVIYARIDNYRPTGPVRGALPAAPAELDVWILSELNDTIRVMREAMDRYDNFPAAKRLGDLVDALSNWYVRRSRTRFWKSGMDADKKAAFDTLYHVLVSIALLSAPFVPFFAETLYLNLVGSRRDDGEDVPVSVHLCDYPAVDASLLHPELQAAMASVREITSLGRAAREQAKIKVRQPLQEVEIVLADRSQQGWLEAHQGLIKDELNVKQVGFLVDAHRYVDYVIKPDFRALGPKLGKRVQAVRQALAEHVDKAALRVELELRGSLALTIGGGEVVELSAADVKVDLTPKPGWAAAQGGNAVVVIATELNDGLRREGLARELIHNIQQARKDLQLRYEQRIELGLEADADVLEAASDQADYIRGEVQADELRLKGLDGVEGRAVSVEGHTVTLFIRPR